MSAPRSARKWEEGPQGKRGHEQTGKREVGEGESESSRARYRGLKSSQLGKSPIRVKGGPYAQAGKTEIEKNSFGKLGVGRTVKF